MPAPKKAGSARRSKANTPAPAADAASSATTPAPRKKRGTRPKKTFLLYARAERELSYICESEGATGQIASINAVKNGTVAAGTPIVFITPATLDREVEVEAENVGVRYKIKTSTKKRSTRKSKPKTPPAAAAASEVPATPAASARSSRSSRAAKAADAPASAPTPPAPGVTSGNPFAG